MFMGLRFTTPLRVMGFWIRIYGASPARKDILYQPSEEEDRCSICGKKCANWIEFAFMGPLTNPQTTYRKPLSQTQCKSQTFHKSLPHALMKPYHKPMQAF